MAQTNAQRQEKLRKNRKAAGRKERFRGIYATAEEEAEIKPVILAKLEEMRTRAAND